MRAIQSKNNVALGELVGFSKESWDQKSTFDDVFPYIEINAIDLKTGDIAEVELLPIANAPSRAKMIVRHNDIIVSTTRPNRGAIAKIEKGQDGSIASTGFAVLRGMKTDKVSKDFLFVMLRSMLSLKQMEQRTTGGNYPAITPEDLKQIRIVVPDMAKQEKITSGVQSSYSKMRTLRAQAAEVLVGAQKQVEEMILA
ncbi:MAG: restriction endonuclease subunit S [Deltaproteobacteria bacterium]|nr:restriction endonuclease subunit S [Deltaproteobacteria bacterium]